MYLEHFGLTELPFRLSPDPEFLYLSKNHARAKTYMESTIWYTDGFVIVTGEVGCGKTTLIETVLSELGKDVLVAQINQTQVSVNEFLQAVLVQFGFSPFQMQKAELLATLTQFLVGQHSAGRKVLLVVDEAQNLSNRVLEEIRLLSGVETTKEKVLRIILAGQPELNQLLEAPEAVQLMQRVRLRFHLAALSETDVRAYVLHRLEVAGAPVGHPIFEEETFRLLFRYSGGVPRLANTLCDSAMMTAFARNRPTVGVDDIESAVDELGRDRFVTPTVELKRPDPAHFPNAGKALARILLVHEGVTIEERELHPGTFVIGRAPTNDLQIDSIYVSRHHCQIVTMSNGSILEDLTSRNGVYVRSKRVRRHNLNDGDVIALGEHQIVYVDERSRKDVPADHRVAPAGTDQPE